MHQWDEGEPESRQSTLKPYRKGAKPIAQRKVIEDCDDGDWIVFPDGPPTIHVSGSPAIGPSDRGRVTGSISGGIFVSFARPEGGWFPGPLHVADGTPIKRTGGTR